MSGTYRVDTDGSFQYPMLGRIAAAGMRVRDIEQMLKTKLEDGFIRRAQVTVDVDQFRSRSIFIVGEVRSPGKYPMTGQMSLIEALAAAGSTTPTASTRGVDPAAPRYGQRAAAHARTGRIRPTSRASALPICSSVACRKTSA